MEPPTVIRLRSPEGLALDLMDQGCTWLSCRVPMPDGSPREVLIGGPDARSYRHNPLYPGATVGRWANRIAGATLWRDGRRWPLAPHPAGSPHQLHGGPDGFSERRWVVTDAGASSVVMRLVSPHGDQGFPGRLALEVTTVLDGLSVATTVMARTDRATPVAITQHAYFNLDGADPPGDARGHTLQLAATHVQPVDADLLPEGPPRPLAGDDLDFGVARTLASRWLESDQQRRAGGLDHGWLLRRDAHDEDDAAAMLTASDGRLAMALHTTWPALQVYAGQALGGMAGRDGRPLVPCAGIALEPGFLVDSPNRADDTLQPPCWLEPGQVLRHVTRHRFRTRG